MRRPATARSRQRLRRGIDDHAQVQRHHDQFVARVEPVDAHQAVEVEQAVERRLVLGDAEVNLADGRNSLLGGESINYTDIAFASFSGLWLLYNKQTGNVPEA